MMEDATDCKVSFEMTVKCEHYVKWCKAFDLIPSEDGFRDYAQQAFLNCVRVNWHNIRIEDIYE